MFSTLVDVSCSTYAVALALTRYVSNKSQGKRDVSLSVHRCICVENKNQLDATEWFFCTYNMLNMFRALLCPSSGARDYVCVITAYGVQCLVAGCWGSVQGSRLCIQEEGCCTTLSCNISLPGRMACCLDLTPNNQRPSTAHHRR